MPTIYVHAWEYVNGKSAGGGGFNWYRKERTRDIAWVVGFDNIDPADVAEFCFDVKVRAKTPSAITREIDTNLIDHCAKAECRKVGKRVLAYWKANKFKMGTATRPARG